MVEATKETRLPGKRPNNLVLFFLKREIND